MDMRALEYLAGRFREAETRTRVLRRELAIAIREATNNGIPQKDICEARGYTRQQVRRIAQAEDEDPAAESP